MKIRKGDQVIVVRGKDRGQKGKIIRVEPTQARVVVEGLNLKKRHRRPRQKGGKGETVLVPSPLAAANVRVFCTSCSKPSRIGYRLTGGKKVRICKKCQSVLD